MDNKILVKVKADITDLNQKLDSAGKKLDSWSKDTTGGFISLYKSIGMVALRLAGATAPFTATGAAIFAMMQKTANAGDEILKLSQTTGISTEALSGFLYAAKLSDINIQDFSLNIGVFSRNVASMHTGIKNMHNMLGDVGVIFAKLGIQVHESSGNFKQTDTLLLELADRFATMEDGAVKAGYAFNLFGKYGQDMIPLLNKGSDGITILMEEAKRLGIVFSRDSAEAANKFNDNITKIKQNIAGLVYSIGNTLIPVINKFFESGSDKILDNFKNLGNEVAELGIRIANLQGQGDTSKLEIQLLDLVDKSLNPIQNLNKEIKELEKRIQGLSGLGDTSGLESRLASLKKVRNTLAIQQFAEEPTKPQEIKTEEQLKKENEERRKWMEWEWKYADTVDMAGQEILNNLDKRDQAIRKHSQTLQSARESAIQLQLKELDLSEQEFRISKSGAVEQRVQLYDELKRIQEEYVTGLDKANDPASWYAQMNAINDTREALIQLNLQLKEQTGTLTEGFTYGFQKFQHDAKTSFQYGQQAAEDTANAIGQTFESISFDAMQGKLKTLGDYFRSFLTSMQRSVSNILGQLFTQLAVTGISSLFGGFSLGGGGGASLGGLGGAPVVIHSGGYIPRFHAGGLNSDEVPAILQRGEYVINRRAVDTVGKSTLDNINAGRDTAPRVPSRSQTNNYFIVDPEAAEAYSKMSERQVEARIAKLMKDNRLKQIRR